MSARSNAMFVLVALTFGSAPLAWAQDRETRIGPIVGFNFAKLSNELSGADSRSGVMAGGFISFRVSRNFAIEPQVVYTQRGAETTVSGATVRLKLDYVEVPVLLKILFPLANNPSTTPHLLLGPAVAFKANCSFEGSVLGSSVSFGCGQAGNLAGVKGTDFGLVGGAGLDVRAFSFGIRYLLGLSKIDSDLDPTDVKHRVLTLFASYGFRLGK